MVAFALHGRHVGESAVTRRSRRAGVVRLGAARILAVVVAIAFLFGVAVCGPAEHAAFESEPASATEALASNAHAPAAVEVDGDHKTPVKKNLEACTGHCVAHSVSLPAVFALEAAAFAGRAVWRPEQDHLLLANRPALLDRPPRA